MRAVLVVNPNATTTSRRTRDVLAGALASEVELRIAQTSRRGHATEIARQAAADGIDLVVSLGGDGTVNEIVNGLLGDYAKHDTLPGALGEQLPILGVVPGGSTNVFGRALGLPRDPVDATGALLEAVRENRVRSVGLGRVNERWFTFCAGFGIDASVVHRVERARRRGKRSTGLLYLRQAATQYFTDLFGANLPRAVTVPTIAVDMGESESAAHVLRWALVQNTAPWTYLGDRALQASPLASFDTGLDLMGLSSLALGRGVRSAAQLLFGEGPRGKDVVSLHDLAGFSLRANGPIPAQVDGEYIGEESQLVFRAAEKALRVAV